ncbi:hypothetical protein CEXT_553901 [Caerostris extrusa]|uniref:Uncharacterized protein n=1 Tax=Caerostris extrusa TaxID=172846 RepID=A0AAV4NNN3_CAEEX|nr:hypothetical protein CEXT_553901 [Caerostris extrusa]
MMDLALQWPIRRRSVWILELDPGKNCQEEMWGYERVVSVMDHLAVSKRRCLVPGHANFYSVASCEIQYEEETDVAGDVKDRSILLLASAASTFEEEHGTAAII